MNGTRGRMRPPGSRHQAVEPGSRHQTVEPGSRHQMVEPGRRTGLRGCALLLSLLLAAVIIPAPSAWATNHQDPGSPPGDVSAAACGSATRSGFADSTVDATHAASIDCLAWWGIAGGFEDGSFRPALAVTRGQMATFLTATLLAADRALPPPGPGFEDSHSAVHARPIARLSEAGLASGFPDGTFRPGTEVTRAQMSSFLVRLLRHLGVSLPAAGTPPFPDAVGDHHAEAIAAVAAAGITVGDTSGAFHPAEHVTRGQMATFLARALGLAVADGVEVRAAQAAVDATALSAAVCQTTSNDVERAEAVLDGVYTWSPHPPAVLGTDLDWTEDPFGDANWRFQFHALRWLWPLMAATDQTGDVRYLEHATRLARSWVAANPRSAPAHRVAWNDHSTAWRTRVLTCLARQGPTPRWLHQALVDHQRALADPDFYVDDGNHALNQDVGLVAAACHTKAWDRRDLGIERIDRLARVGVDPQGVMDEQAVEYQDYNYGRYREAIVTMEACGRTPPGSLERIALMPEALAHMTLPDGTYETLGDTDRRRIKDLGHPATTWLRTAGRDGAPPQARTAVYDAGFYLTRSGWGTERPLLAETFLSARFGPQPFLHGHDDHGAITLFAQGQRILTDPGKYLYGNVPGRFHVLSAAAHNVVTIGAGCTVNQDGPSRISAVTTDGEVDRFRVHVAGCRGTRWTRDVAFRPRDGAVVVVDEVEGPADAAVVQRWQLEIGAEVTRVDRRGAHARWPSGAQLLVEQHGLTEHADAVAGGDDPLRGWVSRRYGDLQPAANLAFTAPPGAAAHFVTVLRPGTPTDAPASAASTVDGRVEVRLPRDDGEVTVIRLGR